jgi:hypothetical protein
MFQSSLRDYPKFFMPSQDCVLGYYQPSLAGLELGTVLSCGL